MDQRIDKIFGLISGLPYDMVTQLADKMKEIKDISPKVKKMISLFDKLSDEDKQQFLNNVQFTDDG